MSLAHSPLPGTRVGGKYRLVRQLAVGGMGEVWLARNQATGADVAVKLTTGDLASHPEAASRFRQEARLGAMLSHRSIVRIFDLVEEPDGALILVMELLRGETLERHLRTYGPLPTKEAVAIVLPVLSALAHAHDSRVVHRDISPANIFLAVDPDGHVIPKLVDFGIAKLPASGLQTLEGRVLGTPRYMAPEQIRGQGELDGRSDLFSVGVVVYEMLTRVSPFAASSASASLAAVLETVVDPDPRIEPRVWVVLQRALSKRPYERHASAQEMAEALRAASGESEADLAHCLRRSPPAREEAGRGAFHGLLTRSVGGHSFGRTGAFFSRRGVLAQWLLGGVLAACLAVVGTAVVRHRRNATAVSSATPVVTTSVPFAVPPAATSAPLAAEPGSGLDRAAAGAADAPSGLDRAAAGAAGAPSPPSATTLVGPTPMPSMSNHKRPTHTRGVKPVATTPGF